jgi:hypothetical protein
MPCEEGVTPNPMSSRKFREAVSDSCGMDTIDAFAIKALGQTASVHEGGLSPINAR